MRDSIRTKEYFDEFINQDTERIRKFQDKLNSGSISEERVPLINNKIIDLKTGSLIAMYSRGDSIDDEDRDAFLKYFRGGYKGSIDSAWYGTHELVNKYQYLERLSL